MKHWIEKYSLKIKKKGETIVKNIFKSIFNKDAKVIKMYQTSKDSVANAKQVSIMWIFGLIMLPNLVFGLSLEDTINKIVDYLNKGIVKSIATLVIIGVGIYMVKNYDRLKEVMTISITIILGMIIILNAKNIADLLS